jgi:putative spermidine/putrescine transport system permease protein
MKRGLIVRVVTGACVILLTVPTVIAVMTSFTPGQNIVFPPAGFTLDWYRQLGSQGEIWRTLLNSLYVGIESVVLALAFGVPAMLGLHRYRVRAKLLLNVFLALGFSTPLIVSGVAFLLVFTELRVLVHLTSVGVAITIVNLPFMLWAVSASIAGQNPELEDAAATLGAEDVQRFLFVTLPSLAPGILTGSLLIFVFGITEFLVSLMLVNTNDLTLPVYLFGSIRASVSPLLAAVAVLYIVVAAFAFALVFRIGRLEQFLHRGL